MWDFEDTANYKIAKQAMRIVDEDRCQWAVQEGYTTRQHSLMPINCSPKNNLVVGVPGHQDSIWSKAAARSII